MILPLKLLVSMARSARIRSYHYVKRRARWKSVVLLALVGSGLATTANAAIKLHGIVRDKGSHRPIGGVVVSASGNLGKYDAVSDDNGHFTLPLIENVAPGQTVKLSCYNEYYGAFQREVPASSDSIIEIELVPAKSIAGPRIEDALFLTKPEDKNQIIELIVSNPTSDPLWIKRLNLLADVAFNYYGVTGFE